MANNRLDPNILEYNIQQFECYPNESIGKIMNYRSLHLCHNLEKLGLGEKT